MSTDSDTDLSYWLLLAQLELTPTLAHQLLQCFGSPRGVFEASHAELKAVGRGAQRLDKRVREVESRTDIAELMRLIDDTGARVVTLSDRRYPKLLREIHAPPLVLFVAGSLESFDGLMVAIVGSRRASPYGTRVTEELASGLARSGVTVVSGMAMGIDSAAHRGALAGGGPTIGVLGCGIDVIYPRGNRSLRERVLETGALITELLPGREPRPFAFPQRNRIVSGLCRGTIVTEAPERSGALITADLALEQGRDVMAVPGEIHSGRSRGCHRLIRDGALLVESVEDVLGALDLEESRAAQAPREAPRDLSPPEQKVLRVLEPEGVLTDHIAEASDLPAAEVASCLMLLEMKGHAQRLPGGRYARR